MKKIIALALALIMALSMASVAFAAPTAGYQPGEKIALIEEIDNKSDWKLSYDFTSAVDGFKGASLIESIAFEKQADKTVDLVLTLKENLTNTAEKELNGEVTLTFKNKAANVADWVISVDAKIVGNNVVVVDGAKKAADAEELTTEMAKNTVMFFEDNGGYVTFSDGYSLTGTVKVEKGDKIQVYVVDKANTDEDTVDAIEAYLGEDYDAIVEWYNFEGTGFGADVDFRYDAYAEDPHYFYAWDGEKFVDLEAKYDDDEDVDDYVFTADAKGIIIVTDVEIVAAEEETKNPDTGANDVVGVAAALAVVSLVAAGAVSLKK